MIITKRIITITAVLLVCLVAVGAAQDHWLSLQPGLELGTFELQDGGEPLRYPLRVLRVDPEFCELVLLNASADDKGKARTARRWCLEEGMLAAINASMYQADHRRSVSLMKTKGHVNNSRLSKDNTVLAFDPYNDSVPPVQIIDRKCQDLNAISVNYGTLVQSIRMVSCRGNNVWAQQERKHSIAAVGVDSTGRFLMMHSRSPLSTHDFIDQLLDLPLDLYNAMYVEGGVEAQLAVETENTHLEFSGGFERGMLENELSRRAWPVPNVIAIRARTPVTGTRTGIREQE